MPLYESQYSHYRDDLTEYLVQVPCLQDRNRRDDIVRDLPAYIQDNVPRRDTLNDDVRNIVATCSRYDEGLKHFFIIVERREGPSKPYQSAFACWQMLRWKITLIELIPAAFSAELLDTLYAACRPKTSVTCPMTLPQSNAGHLVEALWEARNVQGQRLPIVRLAQQLAVHDPSLKPGVKQWLDGVCACPEMGIDAEVIHAAQQVEESRKDANVSLLVSVIPDDPNDEQRVSITLYRWTAETGASEIDGIQAAPQQFHELPAYLFEVVGQVFREQKPQTIELILPLALVTHDVGVWLESEAGRLLLRRSTLLVRLWERQSRNKWADYAYDLWQDRWQRLQAQACALIMDNVRLFDEPPLELEALQYELEDSKNTYGVLFAFSPAANKQKRPLLQRTILNTGMPVALWPHQTTVTAQGVLEVLAGCVDKPLWKHIHELQRQLKPDLGRDVALLWDDPQRELPTFQSFAPL